MTIKSNQARCNTKSEKVKSGSLLLTKTPRIRVMFLFSKNKILVRIVFFIMMVLFLFAVASLFKKTIPFQIQNLLTQDNPIRVQYEADLKNFSDDAVNWILIESISELDPREIYQISTSTEKILKSAFGIESIFSPQNTKYLSIDERGLLLTPFVTDRGWTKSSLDELQSDLWKNNLIREDQKAFLIQFRVSATLPKKEEQKSIEYISTELDKLVKNYPGLSSSLLGSRVASVYFLQEMQYQQKVITPLLLIMICLFMYWCFRSVQIVLWSLLVIFMVYASTLCLIILMENGLGPYSTFALMLSFIVATANLIHFFSRFQQAQGAVEQRLEETWKKSWFPCLLTMLTTAAGFIGLVTNQNLPIRYFGIYCTFACLIEWVTIFYIMPNLLVAFSFNPKPSKFDSAKWAKRTHGFISRNYRTISWFSFALTLFLVITSFNLRIDDNFYTKFKADHPLSRAVQAFTKGFNFVGSVDVVVKPTGDFQFDEKNVKYLENIAADLLQNPAVSRISSPAHIFRDVQKKLESAPEKERLASSIMELMINYGQLTSFYSERSKEFKMTVFLNSLATPDLDNVLGHIQNLESKYAPAFTVRPSGFASIRSFINGRVISDFFESFFTSFILIFLCYWWQFKSIKWSTLALVTNIGPLVIISSLMGIFDIAVDTNLVILICVAFGIAGDNTVHLSHVLREEQLQGLSPDMAMERAFQVIGVAMFATSIIFVACLPVFLLGDLKLFHQISILLTASFVLEFLADTFMFPAIQKFFKWE